MPSSSTNFQRGDVVVVLFPHSDLREAKLRPALVVQDPAQTAELTQLVVAMISTTQRRGPTRVEVTASSPAGLAMGLTADSVIHCDVLQTVNIRLLRGPIGHCPLIDAVDTALRACLGL